MNLERQVEIEIILGAIFGHFAVDNRVRLCFHQQKRNMNAVRIDYACLLTPLIPCDEIAISIMEGLEIS